MATKKHPILKKIGTCTLLVVWTIAVFYLFSFLLSFPFTFLLKHTPISANFAQMFYSVFTYTATIATLTLVPKLIQKKWQTKLEDLGIIGLPTFTDLGLAPASFVIFIIFSGLITMLLSNFSWFNAAETQNIGFSLSYGIDRFFALFSLIIIAPIAEEIIFRGYLFGKLKKHLCEKTKGKKTTIMVIISALITSLIFGIMHLAITSTGIHQLNAAINVFIMSLILCALREISGSIYAGILMHMIKNIVAFYILYQTMI